MGQEWGQKLSHRPPDPAIVFFSKACSIQHRLTLKKIHLSSWMSKTRCFHVAKSLARWSECTWNRIRMDTSGLCSSLKISQVPSKRKSLSTTSSSMAIPLQSHSSLRVTLWPKSKNAEHPTNSTQSISNFKSFTWPNRTREKQ